MATNTTKAKLPADIFDLEVKSHDILKRSYHSYLSAARSSGANAKTRGLVRGGGRKPWRQKGTGRARVGSSRNPIWRGGGIVFGPTGNENYSIKIPRNTKKLAIRQALSLANKAKKIVLIDTFNCKDGKVKNTADLLAKHKLERRVLLVVSAKDSLVDRATRNVSNVKAVQASYLNVFDILNADHIVITEKSIEIIKDWLSVAGVEPKKVAKTGDSK